MLLRNFRKYLILNESSCDSRPTINSPNKDTSDFSDFWSDLNDIFPLSSSAQNTPALSPGLGRSSSISVYNPFRAITETNEKLVFRAISTFACRQMIDTFFTDVDVTMMPTYDYLTVKHRIYENTFDFAGLPALSQVRSLVKLGW